MRRPALIIFLVLATVTLVSGLFAPTLATMLYLPLVLIVGWEILVSAMKPSTPRPWKLFAAGFLGSVIADIVSAFTLVLVQPTDSATVPFAWPIYLASCVLTIAGAVMLEVRRHPRDWHTSLLDAMALVGVLVAAVLVFAASPILDSNMVVRDRLALLAYPLLDAVVLGVVAWMFLSSPSRPRTLRILFCALILWPVSDLLIALFGAIEAPFSALIVPRVGVLASYVVMAYALARPDLEALTQTQPQVVRVSPARAMLLISTLVILPVLLVIAGRSVDTGVRWALVTVVAVVGVATALRFGHLVHSLHRAQRELLDAELTLSSTRNELYRRATIDSITGLPNRLTILERLEAELNDGGTQWVSACYLDLDGFKAVNDTYGHEVGDRLLELVGKRLARVTRGSEAVGRLAGDEFLAVTVATTTAAGVALGQRFLSVMEAPFALGDGVVVSVGASVGVAAAHPGTPIESLLVRADRAMYRAKEVVGNVLTEWTEGIDSTV